MTRIKKLNSVKTTGFFDSFQWNSSLPDFQRYNLIYGFNGCGKTTLARVFGSFETGQLSPDWPRAEFAVSLDNGTIARQDTLDKIPNLFVYSEDYIEKHLKWRDGSTSPISYQTGESERLLEQKRKNEAELVVKRTQLQQLRLSFEKSSKAREKTLTDKARDVSTLLMGSDSTYKNYDRPKLLSDIDSAIKLGTNMKNLILDQDTLDVRLKLTRATDRPVLSPAELKHKGTVAELSKEKLDHFLDSFQKEIIFEATGDLINRLVERPALAAWVKEGWEEHQHLGKASECEMCGSTFPERRKEELRQHFGELLNEHYNRLHSLRNQATAMSEVELTKPNGAQLHDDLQPTYTRQSTEHQFALDKFIAAVKSIVVALDDKKSNVATTVTLDTGEFADYLAKVFDSVDAINKTIATHNSRSQNLQEEKTKASTAIKNSEIAHFYPSLKNIDAELADVKSKIEKMTPEISAIEKAITDVDAQLRSEVAAATKMNQHLASFLGTSGISIEFRDDAFVIKRNSSTATSLSAGERTVLGIVHFLVKLEENGRTLNNCIVIFDDPVSSLDSNNLHLVFAFIKQASAGMSQMFLLTHNFDLFRETKRWLKNSEARADDSSIYLLDARLEQIGSEIRRIPNLQRIDPLLERFRSDYQYLFKQLHDFTQTHDYGRAFLMPNLARQFLECHLAFRVPHVDGFRNQLLVVRPAPADLAKVDQIDRFLNFHSHKDMTEGLFTMRTDILHKAEEIVGDILEIAKDDAEHFKYLCKAVGVRSIE